jgi:ERCC4-type nuclease
VYAALQADASFEVTRRRLDVGDILVATAQTSPEDALAELRAICIERKTWSDLSASICDGRLQEQKSRMLAEPDVRYVYMIEHPSVEPWAGTLGGMRHSCMWGALTKMQLRDNFVVMHSCSPADTADKVLYLAKQMRDGDRFRAGGGARVAAGVQKRKRANLADPGSKLRAMLTVIPGMSADKAEVVCAAFPTVAALVAAPAQAIAVQTSGARAIGPKLAASIKEVFCA